MEKRTLSLCDAPRVQKGAASRWPPTCISSRKMLPVRTFLLLATVIGLAGCFDLSDPDGPSPDDFARNRSAEPAGDPAAPPAESALTTRPKRQLGFDRSDEIVLNDAARQALRAPSK